MTTRSMNQIWKQNPKDGLMALIYEIKPATITQALKDLQWRGSATEEYNLLLGNMTLDRIPPQEVHNIFGCKWVFQMNRRLHW